MNALEKILWIPFFIISSAFLGTLVIILVPYWLYYRNTEKIGFREFVKIILTELVL